MSRYIQPEDERSSKPHYPWGDHPFVVLVGFVVAITALIGFITGKTTLPELLEQDKTPAVGEQTAVSSATPKPIPRPEIITRSAWNADSDVGLMNQHFPDRIILSHQGKFPNSSDTAEEIRTIQKDHIHAPYRGWSDIAWHFIIGRDGKAYEGRDLDYATDSNYISNTNGMISVGILGDYNKQTLTPVQKAILINLLAYLCDEYTISPNQIYPLSEVDDKEATDSPGRNIDIDEIRRDVADRLKNR